MRDRPTVGTCQPANGHRRRARAGTLPLGFAAMVTGVTALFAGCANDTVGLPDLAKVSTTAPPAASTSGAVATSTPPPSVAEGSAPPGPRAEAPAPRAEAPAPAAPSTVAAAPTGSASTQGARMIVGFRQTTIVLYESENSNVGERVPAASLALPLRLGAGEAGGSRLPIATVYGLRWVPRQDVLLN